jgi:hypothetical protein
MVFRLQPIGNRYAEHAGDVVITGPRQPQARSAAAKMRSAKFGRSKQGHRLDHLRDLQRGDPIVAVAALRLDRDEAEIEELGQVRARRRRGDMRGIGKLLGGECTPVHERHHHAGTGRVADHGGNRGEVRIQVHRPST